jgi:hypothetical protein
VVDQFMPDHFLAIFSLFVVFHALVDQSEKMLFGALFSRELLDLPLQFSDGSHHYVTASVFNKKVALENLKKLARFQNFIVSI